MYEYRNENRTAPHPALRLYKGVSSDIFPGVFDWFFTHDVFKRWVEARRIWNLHCIGGPGAGKTTLTSLVYQHLKGHPDTQRYPVVSIYVDQDVYDHENHFIEDFLETLYLKLAETSALENDTSNYTYWDYEEKRLSRPDAPEGCRIRDRLRLLREALRLRLEALKNARAFLLLDGIDRCSQTLRLMLDEELARLLDMGLSVLVTSRLAAFEQGEVRCDHTNHGDQPDDDSIPIESREVLDMYLRCGHGTADLCFACKDANRSCPNYDDCHLYEPYDHVNVAIAVPELAMKAFIAWNLEREHGDLGLGSSARKPPLSPLGKSLLSKTASKSIQIHATDVYDSAVGHIGLAKARLDLLHNMDALDSIETRRDQLPANIITMFDFGLKRMESQPSSQSDIALKAIAAVSLRASGVEIPELRETLVNLGAAETRSGEDILEATRGFLLCPARGDPQKVAVYHLSFYYYIAERYNRAIHRASIQINSPKTRFEPQNISGLPAKVTPHKLARSTTMQMIQEEPPKTFIIRKGTRAWQ